MIASSYSFSVAQWVPVTEAEGPGKRFAIWLQGCPLRCSGCCNPELLPFSGGEMYSLEALLEAIETSRRENAIEGITLLGGEPLAHAPAAAVLAEAVQQRGLSVMVFSGYTLEEIRQTADPDAEKLLRHTDILVDGPYQKDSPDTSRRWIGSSNQRIHFFGDRYHADDACWKQPDTLEVRLEGGELMINGFPAPQATGLWKRLDGK